MAYLLRTPVYLLMDMPYEEFIKWSLYFNKRPIGWREDDRTMKLLQAQGVKAKPDQIFPSLAKMFKSNETVDKDGRINADAFKKSALFQKILAAKGGDKIVESES